jgi:PAS domain S-box-containing protein
LGIYITDPSGDCLYTNPAYQRISGLSEPQALGTGWSRAIHPGDRNRVHQGWYEAARRRGPFLSEHRFTHDDGTVVWTRVNAAEISDGARLVGYVGLVENITEQVSAQEALRQSEERYRAFIEQTSEGVWRFELEQPVPVDLPADDQIDRFYAHAYLAECNDAVARMYGFASAAELIGARLSDMLPRTDPQNLEYLRAFVQSGYRLTDAESHEVDREGRGRYFLNNLIGVVSEGRMLRAWGSQRDVTASRKAEVAIQASEARRRAEDRLRQAERIEVVGQLAGGMAHEANNQMSVVSGQPVSSWLVGTFPPQSARMSSTSETRPSVPRRSPASCWHSVAGKFSSPE